MHTDRSFRFSIRADAWKFPFFPSGIAKDESTRGVLMLRPRAEAPKAETFSELCSVLVLVLLAVSLNWSYNMPVVHVHCAVAVVIHEYWKLPMVTFELRELRHFRVQVKRYPQNSPYYIWSTCADGSRYADSRLLYVPAILRPQENSCI
jgi:hypothetical protein